MQLLVPAYFYPGHPWSTNHWSSLIASPQAARTVAVMNPMTGPGTAADPVYQAAVAGFQEVGGRVLGYIHTGYGTRDPAAVAADIDAYLRFYQVDGFFIDEVPTNTAYVGYYANLYASIKAANSHYLVVGNPGRPVDQAYAATADVLVTYEDPAGYETATPSPWTTAYPPEKFAHLLYGVADAATMAHYVDLAATRNVGWIYVTDASGGNPWDTLPSYWEQVQAKVPADPPSARVVAVGSSGADTLGGGVADDRLYGVGGDDTLQGGAADDQLNGGDGQDSLSGGDGHDTLVGGAGADLLAGGAGNDSLRGGGGADLLLGSTGLDSLAGGDGPDLLTGDNGNDLIRGEAGDDRLFGRDGNDQIFGDSGNDTALGGAGNDRLDGGDGTDMLFGQTGDDSLAGGTGNDILAGGNGSDSYRFQPGDGVDALVETDFSRPADLNQLTFAGVAFDQLWFRRDGHGGLEVSIAGSGDKVVIGNWYTAPAHPVHTFRAELAGTVHTLDAAQVDTLVSAMSAFAPPSGVQMTLAASYPTLAATILAAWD